MDASPAGTRRATLLDDSESATAPGPTVVLGPAGSGKTAALVDRVAGLLASGVPSDRILVLAISGRGAEDLTRRLTARLGAAPAVGTFHSFALSLVRGHYREAGYARPPRAVGARELRRHLRRALARENAVRWPRYGGALASRSLLALLIDVLSGAANNDLSQPETERLLAASGRPDLAELAAFAARYRERMKRECVIDSEQAVTEALHILERHPHVLSAHRARHPHLLVDEFEDATHAQARLAVLLGGSGLFAAGNPSQAISSYRGGSPAYLVELSRSPRARVTRLPTSHRPAAIQALAARLLARPNGPDPAAPAPEAPPPDAVVFRSFRYQPEESAWLAAEIVALLRAGTAPDGIAAVFRTGSDPIARDLAARLLRAGVPVRSTMQAASAGADPLVAASAEVCRYLLAPAEERPLIFPRLLASPLGGLTRAEVRSLRRAAGERGVPLLALASDPAAAEAPPAGAAAAALLSRLASLEAHLAEPPDALLWRVWTAFPAFAEDALRRDPAGPGSGSPAAYRAFLEEAGRIVADTPSATLADILALYDSGHFHEVDAASPDRSGPAVTLATVHQARGREWAHVFLPNLVEDVYPLRASPVGNLAPMLLRRADGGPAGLPERHSAEERRVFGVALTRATERLYLSHSAVGFDGTTRLSPSRYVSVLGLAAGGAQSPEGARGQAGPRPEPPGHTPEDLVTHYRRLLRSDDPLARAEALHALARLADTFPSRADPSLWWENLGETSGARPPYPDGSLHLSASRLTAYRDCPLAYKFAQYLRLEDASSDAMSLGSLLHSILEAYHAPGSAVPRTREALEALVDELFDPAAFSRPPIAAQVRRKITEMLDLYFPRYGQASAVVAVEMKFRFQLGPHFFTGRIDRVDRLPDDTLELIDYKSGDAMSKEEAESDIQLALYHLAFDHAPELAALGTPGRATYLYVKHIGPRADGKRSYTPTEEGRRRLLARVDRYAAGILGETFPSRFHILDTWPDLPPEDLLRAQKGDPCRRCDFTWLCPENERGLADD